MSSKTELPISEGLYPVPVVLVSCIDNTGKRANIITIAWCGVVCSSPPLVSNPKASAELATAAQIVAGQHRIPFVDLHALVMANENWKNAYKQDADDEVYYLSPNAEMQKHFTEAILNNIK